MDVDQFEGSKYFILGEKGILGGKNLYISLTFTTTGVIS